MITSIDNPLAKKIRSLSRRKYRDQEGLFLAEGRRFVEEIPSNWQVECFGVSESFCCQHDIAPFEEMAECVVFSDRVFQSLSDTETPQGIFALCHQQEVTEASVLDKHPRFLLLAEAISDPGNLGTILRTADACNVEGVFLSKGCVDVYHPKVLRATMGSIFHIPICREVDLPALIHTLTEQGMLVLAAHLQGSQPPYAYDLTAPCAVLIGSEARGLSAEASAACSHLVRLPMPGQAESLNASVAAGVLLYEVVRQRTT